MALQAAEGCKTINLASCSDKRAWKRGLVRSISFSRARSASPEESAARRGHERIAQALAWVTICISGRICGLKGHESIAWLKPGLCFHGLSGPQRCAKRLILPQSESLRAEGGARSVVVFDGRDDESLSIAVEVCPTKGLQLG
jgi:hypothetical protein